MIVLPTKHPCCIVCAGLPFRASCCWNGIAVLRAAPFKAGVRIRTPIKPDECQVGLAQCSRKYSGSTVIKHGLMFGKQQAGLLL